MCEGYKKYSPSKQEKQWNAQERSVMYNNLQNMDLETMIDLNSTKEIWERLRLIHEGDTGSNIVEKEKEKEKGLLEGQCSSKRDMFY